VLKATIAWCANKDAKKFADLITACQEVLLDRAEDPDDPDATEDGPRA